MVLTDGQAVDGAQEDVARGVAVSMATSEAPLAGYHNLDFDDLESLPQEQ